MLFGVSTKVVVGATKAPPEQDTPCTEVTTPPVTITFALLVVLKSVADPPQSFTVRKNPRLGYVPSPIPIIAVPQRFVDPPVIVP